MSLNEIKTEIKSRMGWREKLAAVVLLPWLKENGMPIIASVISNIFKEKGWSTSLVGVGMLLIAGFVQVYCRSDATGGWIDPNCGFYINLALYFSGIGHLLAPGYTATVEKK